MSKEKKEKYWESDTTPASKYLKTSTTSYSSEWCSTSNVIYINA